MIDSANNGMDHQFSLANITQVDGASAVATEYSILTDFFKEYHWILMDMKDFV